MDTRVKLLALVCAVFLVSCVKATHCTKFYFSNPKDIQILTNINSTEVVIGNLELAGALDCNICDQKIYWVDLVGKIKRGSPSANGNTTVEVIIERDLRHPCGLAVDWKGNIIYFSDKRGAGKGRIEVAKCDGSNRTVLFSNLTDPGPLAINVITGHLYYVASGSFATYIYQSYLDGENSRIIYEEFDAIFDPILGLSVDIYTNTLYWTVGQYIRSLNLDQDLSLLTEPPMTVFTDESRLPHGVLGINNTVYWTQVQNPDNDQGAIYAISSPGETPRLLAQNSIINPQDISSFLNMSFGSEGCAMNNGGCQIFCFTIPNGAGGTRPQCGCPTGIRLNNDSRTCRADFPDKFLLFTQTFSDEEETNSFSRTEIRIISLDVPGFVDVLVPIDIPDVDSSFLAYDNAFHKVYWAEVNPPAIKRASLDGSEYETFISTSLRHPEGIAIDYLSRNLFWVDSVLDRIEVVKLNDRSIRRVLISGLDHPQGIALSVSEGYIYWTDLDSSGPRVERARMDGTERQVVPDVIGEVKRPTNIAVDPLTNQVYWADLADTDRNVIVRYDGRDHPLQLSNIGAIFGLAILDEHLYWTDLSNVGQGLARADKDTGNNQETILSGGGFGGLVAVTQDALIEETGCRLDNGQCSHLCLPIGNGERNCSCPNHFIHTSETECEDVMAHAYVSTDSSLFPLTIPNPPLQQFWCRIDCDDDGNCFEWAISAEAIDVDFREEMMYWIEAEEKLIYRQSVTTYITDPELFITCCLDTPRDLQVDWLGRNLYWTDPGRGVIEVAKLTGRGRSILIKDVVERPTLISLDPLRGDLYWIPQSLAKIYRIKMDGSGERETFWVAEENTNITGIAINFNLFPNVIFWSEVGDTNSIWKRELESESQVEQMPARRGAPLGVKTLRESVYNYYYDNLFGDSIVNIDDNNVVYSHHETGLFTDLAIMHHSVQPGVHECGEDNGGCGGDQTLCLLSDGLRGVCVCPPLQAKRMTHNPDGTLHINCFTPSTFLLMSTRSSVYYLPIPPESPQSSTTETFPIQLPLGPFGDLSALAYNPVDKNILWIDTNTDYVLSVPLSGSSQPRNISYIENVRPFSMAYDWVGGHVFLTETDGFQIELLTVNGDGYDSIDQQFQRPKEVAFDPNQTIYWINRGIEIRRMALANIVGPNIGEGEVLISCSSRTPCLEKLALEYRTRQLFWINRDDQTVRKYNLLNQAQEIIARGAEGVTALTATTVEGQLHVFWYNNSDHSIYRYNGSTPSVYQQWDVPGGELTGFLGFERLTSFPPDTCLGTPRPCSHLCLPTSSTDITCACPAHRHLQDDGRTCSNISCSPLEYSCGEGSECYPATYYCDGVVHCRNGFDEDSCPCNTSDMRTCAPDDNTCISSEKICDGSPDCPNGEDEMFCPCVAGEFYCLDPDGLQRCFQQDALCDGYVDCRDGSDERNCPTPIIVSPTPTSFLTTPTSSTSPSPSEAASIDTRIIITVSIAATIVLLIIFIFVTCFLIRFVIWKRKKYNVHRASRTNTLSSKPSASPQPSGFRSDSVSEISNMSMDTYSTQVGLSSNMSPSADSTFKRYSATDPSNPPPSPCTTMRHSMGTMDMFSAISEMDPTVPPPPPPSVNYDAMSGVSISVSRRNVPAAINGHIHMTSVYPHSGRNPLMGRYPSERSQHAYHSHHPHYDHHHNNHINRFRPRDLDTRTETDSTLSMMTTNTDTQDIFHYDITPPGRPPSPATITEVSEHHLTVSPTSPISEYSEQFLHED